jgi:hypothetical protein
MIISLCSAAISKMLIGASKRKKIDPLGKRGEEVLSLLDE